MATTTATFSLSSADIAPSPVRVSSTTTLYKAGLSTGLDQIQGMSRRILKTAETGKTLLISPALYGMQITKGSDQSSGDGTIEFASASPTLANLGVNAGMIAYGTGIADGTTVGSITDADTLELSSNAASTSAISSDDGTIAFFERATANKANKVYICNSSATSDDYIEVTINQEVIGRLYGGDWMFMPWSVSDLDSEIYVTAPTHTTPMMIDYMVVGEGNAA
tara:strand:- start:1505 stop:2173 length:669 start_codon:yes stop_codon:yes gene_type:complete